MNETDFDAYRTARLAEGYDEVAERAWPPGAVADRHAHDFAVRARVVEGEMRLLVDGDSKHLRAGDTFELEPGVPHAERYGDAGATYWAARRHG